MKRQTTQEPKNSSRLSHHHLFLSVSLPEGTMGCSAAIRATTPERWTSALGLLAEMGWWRQGFELRNIQYN